MRKHTLKLKMFLILNSIFLLACQNHSIVWRDYSNTTDKRLELYFETFLNMKYSVILEVGKTKSFRIPRNYVYSGYELPANCYLAVYPFFTVAEQNKGNKHEVFVYNFDVVKKDKDFIELNPRENIIAYYAEFYKNDELYVVLSKKPFIQIQESINTLTKNSFDDFLVSGEDTVTYLSAGREDYDGVILCGYIVKSLLNNSYIWLEPRNVSAGMPNTVFGSEN